MYIFRLDDASEYMDVDKWNRIETLFDEYGVKPIVGIIPHNEDEKHILKYGKNDLFWEKASKWKEKGWRIALHGYNHVFISNEGGLNPVNNRSEFAGVPINEQRIKIREGYKILCEKNLKPDIFFAPAHTYDENTLIALKEETEINIISDTFASDIYFRDGFYYIPQQIGKAKKLPFRMTTICLHPNTMKDNYFANLRTFIEKNRNEILDAKKIELKNRKKSFFDNILQKIYILSRRLK